MNFETVLDYIQLYAPTVIAAIGSIITFCATIKKAKQAVSEDVVETRALKKSTVAVNEAVTTLLGENKLLRERMANVVNDNCTEIEELKKIVRQQAQANKELANQVKELTEMKDDLAVIKAQNQAILNEGK